MNLLDNPPKAAGSAPDDGAKIRCAPGVRLSPDQIELLARAFDGSSSIFVKREFHSGYSGSVVLLVSLGSDRAPVVLKLAHPLDLQREYEAYHRFVRPISPQNIAHLQGEPLHAANGQLGLLQYSFAGGESQQHATSLKDYYESHDGSACAAVLNRIFRVYGRYWWGDNRPHLHTIGEQYDHLLPVHLQISYAPSDGQPSQILEAGNTSILTLRQVSIGQHIRLLNFGVTKVQAGGRTCTLIAPPPANEASAPLRIRLELDEQHDGLLPYHPGNMVEQIDAVVVATRQTLLCDAAIKTLSTCDPDQESFSVALGGPTTLPAGVTLLNPLYNLADLLDRAIETKMSTIHGDLNLQNILVDAATGFAWLIDFSETRRGPTLFDLQRLEVQIITKLLSGVVRPLHHPLAILAKLMATLHADPLPSAPPIPELLAPFEVLVTVRRLARQYLIDDLDWDEYYLGLVVALVGALKYDELDTLARSLALVAAATVRGLIGHRLQTGHRVSALLDEPPDPGESPFIGLQHYTEANAHLFFGRELLTARLVGRLRQHRFLAVIGTSGSGKSSVVRAGLIPALRRGEPLADGTLPPDGSAEWLIHVITPTAQPLDALAASLTRDSHSITETTMLLEDLTQESRTLYLHAHKLLSRHNFVARPHGRLLLVVDQFEELFTLCRSEQERSSFVANLLRAVEPDVEPQQEGPAVVVIVLRADFYAHCARYEGLRNALVYQDFIGPMNEEELRRAIEEPAKQGGWKFEPGVIELLLRDVGNEPGALPLLSHALLETWKRRHGRTMLLESYSESGMVRGAIAKTAEFVFNHQLTPEQRPLARNIFLRLTELGESMQDSRRRVALDELLSTGGRTENVESILHCLVDARLVTTGEGTVELAHEALIREWPTLRQWLVEHREWLRMHRHLTEAAQEWLALERDAGELYRGGRLAQAQEWAGPHWDELNDLEREFLAASQRLAEHDEAEKLSRQQRELEQARALAEVERERVEVQIQTAQQLRRRAILLAGLLVVALLLAIVSVLFGRASNRNAAFASQNAATAQAASTLAVEQEAIAAAERDRAEQQAQVALSRQLAAQASNLASDLDLGLLLSLEAGRVLPGSLEYKESLLTLLQASPQLTTFLHGHSSIVFDVAVSPDGNLAASAGQDQTVILWDLESHQHITTLSGHTNWVSTVRFSPDSQILASGSDAVQLWDANTHAPIGAPFAHNPNMIWALAFHPERPILAVASVNNTITLWSLEDIEHPTMLGAPLELHTQEVRSLDFSPDGTLLASGSWDNTIALWDMSDPAQPELLGSPLQEHTDWVRSIAFHPNSQILASGGADNRVILWDLQDPSNPRPLAPPLEGHSNLVYSVAFSSPDGELLATSGGDKTILLWDVSNPTAPQRIGPALIGHSAVVQSVTFSADGTLLSASDDSTVAVWDPSGDPHLARTLRGHAAPVNNVAFSPDGTLVASASNDGSIRLWDTSNGSEPRPLGEAFQGEAGDEQNAVAFSLDGRILASAGNSGSIILWDLAEPDSPQTFGAPLTGHTDWISTLAFHPTESILASASGDTTIRLWDVSDPAVVKLLGKPLSGHSNMAISLAFNANGTILASGGGDNLIILWDMATRERKTSLAGHTWRVWSLDFSPASDLLASGGQDSFLILWDVDQILASIQPDNPMGVTQMEPSFAQSFTNHANTVSTVAYSPDGTMLASAGVEQKVLLWDMQTRQQLGPALAAHTGAVVSSTFSPNGEWLVTGGYDNRVILWDVSLNSWQKLACRIANRNLTPAEWTQYVGAAPYQPTCPELIRPPT